MSMAASQPVFEPPRRTVVMGVAGCGKSTVALALAQAVGAEYLDGDAFHPKANIEKMRQGVPLTDDDRWPWLDAVAAAMRAAPGPVVVACSALRRAYRDRLRQGAGGQVFFAFLDGSFGLTQSRMRARAGHFMPASLLQSQFDTLERPGAGEWALAVDISGDVAQVVAQITRHLRS